ncbi:MAG: protein-L-isoaspartate(D-aspartate) O-methyltransferase [Clostridiales bacterium]|nr:protein-L-isoaspartate(D-aspartate) O-methyltransferase [Clostridiales bacterium]
MKQELVEFYRSLDRSRFLSNAMKPFARVDGPLPIGHDQTISQPALVLEMTDLLELTSRCRVLEIGTGSGYQTAFLAQFSREVYTVERIPELAEMAQTRLLQLGYRNIFYRIGDGSAGWPEHAPFDRIIVTAAAGKTPGDLIRQLARNGIMIVPVGPPGLQRLTRITRDKNGTLRYDDLLGVAFVELKGKYGWRDDQSDPHHENDII